jgi:hypothetical protein
MKFTDTNHHCDVHTEWDNDMTTNGEVAERRGVCQECGRVVIEQYDFKRLQDAESGEFVQFD